MHFIYGAVQLNDFSTTHVQLPCCRRIVPVTVKPCTVYNYASSSTCILRYLSVTVSHLEALTILLFTTPDEDAQMFVDFLDSYPGIPPCRFLKSRSFFACSPIHEMYTGKLHNDAMTNLKTYPSYHGFN